MLGTVIIFLMFLWVLGIVSGQNLGGFIHLLLVGALTVFAVRILSGKKLIR
jgi:hypothetical protein